ncbi:hypothetical protein [Paenochrobactrum glaciei]|uniref:Uncharacterized protein n=1 Tax=Paenochrobactrum glaciei TaxID=486407 RepID=A0ABN1FEA8_9HYPH
MTAMKKTYEPTTYQHHQLIHSIQAADYSDDVADDYVAQVEAIAAPLMDDEEWFIVDGPAW